MGWRADAPPFPFVSRAVETPIDVTPPVSRPLRGVPLPRVRGGIGGSGLGGAIAPKLLFGGVSGGGIGRSLVPVLVGERGATNRCLACPGGILVSPGGKGGCGAGGKFPAGSAHSHFLLGKVA